MPPARSSTTFTDVGRRLPCLRVHHTPSAGANAADAADAAAGGAPSAVTSAAATAAAAVTAAVAAAVAASLIAALDLHKSDPGDSTCDSASIASIPLFTVS